VNNNNKIILTTILTTKKTKTMSALITIVKQSNNLSTYVGHQAEYANKATALDFLFSQGILPADWRDMHPSSIYRNAEKKNYLRVEVKKGSLRADNPFEVITEQPKTEQPKTEQPKTEQPKTEQPKTETPMTTPINAEELAKQFTTTDGNNPFAMMAQMIAPFVKPDYAFAAETISKLVADAVAQIKPERIEVVSAPDMKVELGRQHYAFKKILNAVAQRVHLMLVGAAGSGKTTCAHNVADALGLKFYAMSVGQQTTKSDIFGFVDAHSNYKRTQFRDAFENGGVFLFDEIDAGNAGVLTAINAALANGTCAFPDGMVKRSDDFVCIAAGNTFGRGADRQYVGRQQLDAATLDRFAVIDFDYDEELELEISGNRNWTRQVQRMRANAMANNLRVVISPRASINGAKLLAAGFTESEVKEMIVFKGIGQNERNIIENGKA
jgi:cobaltochelatase CobS